MHLYWVRVRWKQTHKLKIENWFGPLSLHFEIDQNFMDPWILRDMECLNSLPSCSHQQLSFSIQKDLKLNKLWHRKPRNLLQVGNIQNFGPLKFSLDPLNLDFAVLKGSGKIQLDPLNFWVRATPGLNY